MPPEFDVSKDYYEILQVHPKAEPAVIRGAYRVILKELQGHPDLGGSHEQAILLNEAYHILGDTDLRASYDRARQHLLNPLPISGITQSRIIREGWEEVICPACGRSNHLRPGRTRTKFHCGACRSPLFPASTVKKAQQPPSDASQNNLRLPKDLFEELSVRGELELRTGKLPRGGKLTCRRCRRVWVAPNTDSVPPACPACGAADWNSFRAFKCRHCSHEFTTYSLRRR